MGENRWPLYSFESNDDYIYDVAWSPTHPALFATVDGTGRLDLWNLNNDTEESTASDSVDGPPAAFNRVSWTQSGLHVTAGDDNGKIWVFDLNPDFANPAPDEWNKFAHTLQDIKNNKTEDDLDKFAAAGTTSALTGPVTASGPGSLPSLSSLSSSPLR